MPQIFRALPEFSGTFLLISAIKTNSRHDSILEEKIVKKKRAT
jgi:hypothetical protein